MSIIIYGNPNCPDALKAKELCVSSGVPYDYKVVGHDISNESLVEQTGHSAAGGPQIFVMTGGFAEYIGGLEALRRKLR